jgi:hypothetical protein
MQLILSPKDNLGKIILEDVATFAVEGPTLLVVFESGETRNYPLVHLWYYRSHVQDHMICETWDEDPDPGEELTPLEPATILSAVSGNEWNQR